MNFLEELFARIVEMQKEIIDGAGAVPFFFYQQETFPYFTNRLGEDVITFDSEDYSVRTYTITMRFVMGHITEGQAGAPETQLYTHIPTIEQHFLEHPQLTSDHYPTPITGLSALNTVLTRDTGLRVFNNAGILAQQVGCEFSLSVPYHSPIDYED